MIGPLPIIQVTIGGVTVDCLVDSGSQVSTIGPHPIIQVTIGGVTVDCLVDSGSQVSTIGPHPIIQVTIGGVTVDCLVDSGSQVSMICPHPIIQATIGEVTVDCLVDSGSQVSMIEECFFKQHLRAKNLTDDGKEHKERIVEKVLFKDVQTMLIMLFYQAILPLIKNYVVLFQSNVPLVHKLHDRQEQLFRHFLSCFIKQEELVDKSATQLNNLGLT